MYRLPYLTLLVVATLAAAILAEAQSTGVDVSTTGTAATTGAAAAVPVEKKNETVDNDSSSSGLSGPQKVGIILTSFYAAIGILMLIWYVRRRNSGTPEEAADPLKQRADDGSGLESEDIYEGEESSSE